MNGASKVQSAIVEARERHGVALIAYLTAGFPTMPRFLSYLDVVSGVADVVEVGVPYSNPMADGVTIQRSSREALEQGVTLDSLLCELEGRDAAPAPVVLMSYLNPVLQLGFEQLAVRSESAGVSGIIVPDLPFDEGETLASPLREAGLSEIQMVTPFTARDRLDRVARASSGFLYAVTGAGATGARELDIASIREYLGGLRSVSAAPVCAGFGIRTREHVDALTGACDGVVVGSALVDVVAEGGDASAFLSSLRVK